MSERKVWKYSVPMSDTFTLAMPSGAQVLDVQVQQYDVVLWALIDPSAAREDRLFRLAGTGHPIMDDVTHVGSIQIAQAPLVFHLFEVHA